MILASLANCSLALMVCPSNTYLSMLLELMISSSASLTTVFMMLILILLLSLKFKKKASFGLDCGVWSPPRMKVVLKSDEPI